jgi:site-specific DNA-cytosine methylase
MEVQHVAGCEIDEKKRAFVIQHFEEFGNALRDVADMANQYVLGEKRHESVQRPEADVLVTGFRCKDISGLTTKPKSERGDNNGTSANTLRGTLRYIQACAWENRPDMVVLENVRASVELHCTWALRCAQTACHACLSLS